MLAAGWQELDPCPCKASTMPPAFAGRATTDSQSAMGRWGNPNWLSLEQALIQCHFVGAGGWEASECDASLLQTTTDPHGGPSGE